MPLLARSKILIQILPQKKEKPPLRTSEPRIEPRPAQVRNRNMSTYIPNCRMSHARTCPFKDIIPNFAPEEGQPLNNSLYF